MNFTGTQQYWLRFDGHDFRLNLGETVVGRGEDCHVVLDDPMASRKHARFIVAEREIILEDLKSANGTFVNGKRLTQTHVLKTSDEVSIGKMKMSLTVSVKRPKLVGGGATLTDMTVAQPSERIPALGSLETLSTVAKKILAMGRAEEAERMVGPVLKHVLEAIESGERLPELSCEVALELSLSLAKGTRQPKHLSYAFKLATLQEFMLKASQVEELHSLVRSANFEDTAVVEKYLAVITKRELSVAERFQQRRIEGLLTLMRS